MKKITPSKVVVLIVTILWVFVGIFPLIWMISSATKDNAEVQAVPPKLIPTVPNELYFTLDYSDMEWEPDEIKAQIKRDFVNVLIGYPMEFSNIHNGGAHICATYNGRMLAKAHMASFERAEAVLDAKIYAIKAIPLTFERKIDELFPYTDTDFYFNSEVSPESPKTYTNEATAEITAFYADYGLRGTVTL